MKNILLILFLFMVVATQAQYVPNAGAYQYKGLKQTNSLQPPSTSGAPVTSVNAPDSNYAALYYNKTDTTWYQFNPISKTWSLFRSGGGVEIDSIFISSIDSIFITNTDSIFIVSGNDTIFIGEADNIRDTADLTAGYGIIITDGDQYSPNGVDNVIVVDTSALSDFIVQVINIDTTNINNSSDTARFIVDTIANSPPVGATDGYKVLVGAVSGGVVVANPTGLFSGHGEEVAELVGSVWNFTIPDNNDQLIVDNTNNYSTWQYVNGVWRRTARLVRWGGDRALGANAFIGRTDQQNVPIRAGNATGLIVATTRDVLLPKYTGLQDEPLFFKPGLNGKLDTARFTQPVYSTPAIQDSILYIEDGVFKYGTASGGGGGTTTNALTFDNSGVGDASGTTFNGSLARTLSYNSIGAVPITRTITINGTAYDLSADRSWTTPGAALTSTYVGFGDGSNVLTGSSNLTYASSQLSITNDALGATVGNGALLVNNTAATASVVQYSPALKLRGYGWNSAGTPASNPLEWSIYTRPSIGGTTTGFSNGFLIFRSNIAGEVASINQSGGITSGSQSNFAGIVNSSFYQGAAVVSGTQLYGGGGVSSSGSYKLTDAGSAVTPAYYGLNSSRNILWDGTNGLNLGLRNTNVVVATHIAVVGFNATNVSTTQGAETADMSFYTKPTGSALVERGKITGTGVWTIFKPISFTGSTPSNAAGTGAGTSPTISVTGNDAAGYVTITTGTSPTASGDIVTITFSTALANTPTSVQITPANENAATECAKFYVDQSTASSSAWKIKNTSSALTASTEYKFYYHVTQ